MKLLPSILVLLLIGLLNVSSSASAKRKLPHLGREMRPEFYMDPDFIQLNHGAYGTYPKAIGEALHEYQARSERNPDLWIRREARQEWDKVRKVLADLINADSEDVVMVINTTNGINSILRSMVFNYGERILHISTIYNSMNMIIQYLMDYSNGGISSVVFNATYPMTNDQFLSQFQSFLEEIHDPEKPIRLALIDHITSSPAVVVPIDRVIPMLKQYNITVLIDGAHAIGQVPIDIKALAPDYYVTNCHKWLYAARGCALLYVDKKHQDSIHPAHINSGYRQPSDFLKEFFWTGTMDYSSYMTVFKALEFRQEAGGEQAIMNYTHNLAIQGGQLMASKMGTEVLQYPDQIGGMVDVRLPIDDPLRPDIGGEYFIDEQLYRHPNTFVSIYMHNGQWWARVSAQIYNDLTDFDFAAEHLLTISNEINSRNLTLVQ